jgi:YgiT-type zinc finger domain-containing protein
MEASFMTCTSCGGDDVRRTEVRSAFWHDDRLVVVEDIPALRCGSCGEQFFDDDAVVVLDLLRGDGFQETRARATINVPVFSYRDQRRGPEES